MAVSLASVMFVVLGVGLLTGVMDGGSGGRPLGAVFVVAAPLAGWRFAWYPLVQLTSEALTIVNPFQTTSIALVDIRGVGVGARGMLTVRYSDGTGDRLAYAVAMQAVNVGRRSRARAVIEQINAAVAGA